MSQQITVITTDEPITRVQPRRLISISSGPMSEGMIPSVSTSKERRKTNNSTEHICTFSVCLMFIGVPIIFIGFLTLTFFPPIAIIMILIGVVASVSGTILVILSAIIMLISRKSSKSKSNNDIYDDGQPPEIIIDETLYTENFEDNLCEESQDAASSQGLSDLPSMDKLDPVEWSNYPEAQNPKSYLQSFGELPKALASPNIRPSSSKRNRNHKKSSKKTSKKVRRQLSKLKGMGSKQKTTSQTSLTHDFSDEIDNDSDSSLSSSSNDGCSPVVQKSNNYTVNANLFGNKHNGQSVVTIENTGQYDQCTSDDLNDIEEEVLSSSVDNIDGDCSHSNHQTIEETTDRSSDNYANNEQKYNNINGINKTTGILADDCTDSIELNDTIESIKGTDKRNNDKNDTEFEEYSDLWNTIRSVKTERITKT